MPELSNRKAFMVGLWQDNPIFRQVLGICSTLAVTNLMRNTLVMVIGLIYATAMSNLTMSILRDATPRRIRIMVEILIISFYVVILHIFLQAFLPEVSRDLGPYVGLIITNCILQGRLEAFAINNKPIPSFLDGLGSGIGYGAILIVIACIREPAGFGTLMGYPIMYAGWTKWTLMVMPAGAFFLLAVLVWLCRRATDKPLEATR